MSELDRFWAKSLGCSEEDLNFNESKIVVRTEETDYNKDRTENEIDIFQRNGKSIVSCSTEMEDRLRKHESELLETDITEKEIENIGLKPASCLAQRSSPTQQKKTSIRSNQVTVEN